MSGVVKFLHRQFVVPWNEFVKTLQHNYAKDGGYFPRLRGVLTQWARLVNYVFASLNFCWLLPVITVATSY